MISGVHARIAMNIQGYSASPPRVCAMQVQVIFRCVLRGNSYLTPPPRDVQKYLLSSAAVEMPI